MTTSGYSIEQAKRRAQKWANEQNAPFTVYKDPSGAFMATELKHFQNNPEAHKNCEQIENFYPEKADESTPAKTKYYVCAPSMGGEIYGKPMVLTSDELREEKRKASDATAGEWTVKILHEIETLSD